MTHLPLFWNCRFEKSSYPGNLGNPENPGSDVPYGTRSGPTTLNHARALLRYHAGQLL